MGAIRGGAKQLDLVIMLTDESASSVDWLVHTSGFDLSLVSQLGGHSKTRTHRVKNVSPA